MNMEIVSIRTFTGFATTEEGQWSEDRLRDEWQRLLENERRKPDGDIANSSDTADSHEMILETFAPGRIYTTGDVMTRCEANGNAMSEKDTKRGLRRLIREKRVESLKHPTGGQNKLGQIYKLAERDD